MALHGAHSGCEEWPWNSAHAFGLFKALGLTFNASFLLQRTAMGKGGINTGSRGMGEENWFGLGQPHRQWKEPYSLSNVVVSYPKYIDTQQKHTNACTYTRFGGGGKQMYRSPHLLLLLLWPFVPEGQPSHPLYQNILLFISNISRIHFRGSILRKKDINLPVLPWAEYERAFSRSLINRVSTCGKQLDSTEQYFLIKCCLLHQGHILWGLIKPQLCQILLRHIFLHTPMHVSSGSKSHQVSWDFFPCKFISVCSHEFLRLCLFPQAHKILK